MNQGWVRKKLKDCFKLKSGDGLTAKKMIAGDYPVYGGNSQAGTHNQLNLSGDNVIVGRVGALCGNARHITDDIWLTDNAFKVMDKKFHFENDFLTYLLNFRNLRSLARQAAQPVISNSSLSELELEFPLEAAEQKRIVAILDQAFADIELARAKTEQNLLNARELFESYLQQVFSQRGEGWVECQMSDICEIKSKLVDPKEDVYLDFPHIGAGNIISITGKLIDVKTAREEGLISGKFVFDETMVLYSKIRPYLMKVCRPNFIGLCSADVYPLAPVAKILNRSYLFYLLLCKDFTDYAISGSGRAGMPKVNRTHLFSYPVRIPSIEVQSEYVAKIDMIAEQSQSLEKLYSSKLLKLDELKKSILQKAFSGELTKAPAKKTNKGAA